MAAAELDIILPCYNPVQGWADSIIEAYGKISAHSTGTINIIVVNDGSVKGIHEEDVRLLRQRLPHFSYLSYSENRGKGYALRTGVKASTAKYCIYTDIDFPYQEENLTHIFSLLKSDQHDVVAGVRDETYYAEIPRVRLFISRSLKVLMRTLLKLPTYDTQCGLKGFNQKGKEVFLKTTIDRYLFDLEFIFLCGRNKNLTFSTAVVQLKSGVQFSKMKTSILMKEGGNFVKIFYRSLF